MKIVNCMFGAKLGGLEQVFVDYSEALAERRHEIINFVVPHARITGQLEALKLSVQEFSNFNHYDFIAAWRIRRSLKKLRPDVVIAHGNRAINLLRIAAKGVAPLVAVNHGINLKRTVGADYTIAINEDMRTRLIAGGQKPDTIFKVFNMIRMPEHLPGPQDLRFPPTIAVMGRFVSKKGFDIFIKAIASLKEKNIPFKAVLAGDGPLAQELKTLTTHYGLAETVTFPGWIQNKAAFFDATDIFCFTSSHDVFPVVLLEAFLHGKPVVMTDCPGPREISTNGEDSLLFPINDAVTLAAHIKSLIANPDYAKHLATAAQNKILQHYIMQRIGEVLEQALMVIKTATAAASSAKISPQPEYPQPFTPTPMTARLARTVQTWPVGMRKCAENLYVLYQVAKDRRISFWRRMPALLGVAYFFSPIDLIPDSIFILGYMDDIAMVALGIWISLKLVEPNIILQYRRLAMALFETTFI